MTSEFPMPSLGADMEDGRLVEWEKRPGDVVARGDVIAVVETQKGAIEIEAYEDGVLEAILVEPGTSVPVGTPLALIRVDGEPSAESETAREAVSGVGPAADPDVVPAIDPATDSAADSATDPDSAVPSEASAEVRVEAGERGPIGRWHRPGAPEEEDGRARVSPAARRRASVLGVDPGALHGSGPDGAVVLADVERAAASERPSSPAPPSGMRDAIAAAMTHSKREIPHYYLAHSADLTRALDWLAHRNAERVPLERVPMATLFVGAVARAARAHPRFNGHWVDGAFRASEAVHLGMAIRLRGAEGGLVAPALHDADRDDPETSAARLRDLVERVRAGRFRSAELADPTLTLSSVGERGVETLYGVVHPPQVCLVGIGAPHRAARVREGEVVVAPVVSLTLAADHRVTDGHAGSRFLADIARRLEDPEELFTRPP